LLAQRIVEFVEGDIMDGVVSSSVTASHMQPGSSIGSSTRDHEELRRSVREAFAPGSHR
jgi:vacuolar protein 8